MSERTVPAVPHHRAGRRRALRRLLGPVLDRVPRPVLRRATGGRLVLEWLGWFGAMSVMAGARAAVDRFFDEVMVMADDPRLRGNRLALLEALRTLMNRVADISKLG